MPDVVRRAYCTSSLGALEAAPMVCTPIHRHLLSWIGSLGTSLAFVSGSAKHGRDFAWRFLAINRSFYFCFWCTIKAFVKAAGSLEELIEMWSAIQHPFEGVEVAKLEGAIAMVATETSFVVDLVIGCELIYKIDGLITRLAFGICACNCSHFLIKFVHFCYKICN